jgi:hypothetical protein
MDRAEYNALKESGGLVTDAALQEEPTEPVVTYEEEPEQDEPEQPETDEQEVDEGDDDLPPLPEKEKTAFEKRMERERAKLEERLKAEMEQQYEQKYGKHKQVVELLGGDPDAIEKRIRDNQLAARAQEMADMNGWDPEQTQWYIEQEKQKQELQDLRVTVQINRLRDNPDYAGITSMEKEIKAKIEATKGALSVDEAYWALGGHKRAEQIKVEAQMREQVKRQKQPRTVLTDSPAAMTGEKPLPADVMRDAERMGISAAEARKLMSKEPARNIDEWRKSRAK